MNLTRLYEILRETTREFRKGEVIEGSGPLADALRSELAKPADKVAWPNVGGVAEIYMMPHADEAPSGLELVDCEFIKIGVDKAKAQARKAELINILKGYHGPHPLSDGPSYIEVGGVIGDQSAAFCLFALGKVLDLWTLITPALHGFEGREARQMAESGFIMIIPKPGALE